MSEGRSMSSLYRADHIGSLLRPTELLEARRAHVTLGELATLEDHHISRVLQKQQELGLGVFTDGELQRSNFMSDFTDAVDGFDTSDAVARSWSDNAQRSPVPAAAVNISGIVTAPLKPHRSLTGRELPLLREHAPGRSRSPFPALRSSRQNTALRTRFTGTHTHCSMQSPASRICRSMRRAIATTSIRSGPRGWQTNCAWIRHRC